MSKVSYEFAYTIGISHGYSAAQYSEAYGAERTCSAEHAFGDSGGYENGWAEGWDRYERNEWPDGTSRLSDDEIA